MQTQTNGIEKRNGRAARESDASAPAVDVFENDQEILIVADLPGVPADAIEVVLDGSELRLEGRREGRSPARLRRAFAVPPTVDPDRISARVEAGVLTLRLGKRQEVKPRRIEVQRAD